MALNLAPFSRWTLRDKAAQRRLALRWASMKTFCAALLILMSSTAAAKDSLLFADSKCREGYEFYFLNRAASSTDVYGASLLLKGGANVDGKGYETYIKCGGDMEYSSPLMVAVYVVAHEAATGDPHRVDRAAVLEQGMEMVELLLKAGANPNIKEGEGVTPLDIARQYKHSPTISLLKQHGAK